MTSDTTLRRLPNLSLPSAPDGAPVSLRTAGRQGTVLVTLHTNDCADCLAYLRSLADLGEQLADWDGRVLVVVPGGPNAATVVVASAPLPFQVLADPEGRCRQRCGVGGGGMVIADQWGEVFFLYDGSADTHSFPAPEEVVEWLRFMAIQCPECQGEAY